MAGKPFKVGRFAHTLRVRLMREHVGVDVDAIYDEDLMAADPVKPMSEQDQWDPNNEQAQGKEDVTTTDHVHSHGAIKRAVQTAEGVVSQGVW
jgi:phospholipase D1/2